MSKFLGLSETAQGLFLILVGVAILWVYFYIVGGPMGLHAVPIHLSYILITIGLINFIFGKIKNLR